MAIQPSFQQRTAFWRFLSAVALLLTLGLALGPAKPVQAAMTTISSCQDKPCHSDFCFLPSDYPRGQREQIANGAEGVVRLWLAGLRQATTHAPLPR